MRCFILSFLLLRGRADSCSVLCNSEGIWDNYRVKRHMIHSSCVPPSFASIAYPSTARARLNFLPCHSAVIASNLLITDEMMVSHSLVSL